MTLRVILKTKKHLPGADTLVVW